MEKFQKGSRLFDGTFGDIFEEINRAVTEGSSEEAAYSISGRIDKILQIFTKEFLEYFLTEFLNE